ncbi:hypothetical protein EDD90_3325 [Streptomyces sp. Ag109_O5-1]|uniref:DUF6415 family natural product biosynthesis protein n=1 Tax=Streptomyces sp. Ag109_O5-1 TaxID=1938851 RepID=UPI000F507A09|nr:DUF6415 family natural product biosynthesis protein [Streptomyces sp. Ag109_O5-1]RPE40289.1 hypothetical protein EDD90_3325 [Streptomyces sp. Ag109_O5-1]
MSAAARSAGEQADLIPALIGEAFESTRNPPPPARFAEIDRALRGEIKRLSKIADGLCRQRPHRSRGWYALVNAIEKADDALSCELAEAPLAAGLHVSELARRVLELKREIAS